MSSTPRLPSIGGNGKQTSRSPNADDEIEALRREVERLQNENRVQADQLSRSGWTAGGLDPLPFTPKSPTAVSSGTTTPRRPQPPTMLPGPLSPHTPRPPHIGPTSPNQTGSMHDEPSRENPLREEYRQIQESAMRWVTTDQPFIRPGGKKGINMCDDVQEDFYRALINQATFNLPRELKFALSMAEESLTKTAESKAVLEQSQLVVDKSSADTLVDIRNEFELTRERLRNKQLYFDNEVSQYREEMHHKVDTELAIVQLLIKTLDDSIRQANNVLDRNYRSDAGSEGAPGSKTINDIRAEFNKFRRAIMPTMGNIMGENIAGRAAEYLSLEKGATIHEIISALLQTLMAALQKAQGTEERLLRHKAEIAGMCEETLQGMARDFEVFFQKAIEKEQSMVGECETYKRDTTTRIQANLQAVQHYSDVLQDHLEYGERMLNKGNDYQMFKQAKEMKNQMVLMYAELSKMRIQYDGILFQPNSDELNVPLDFIGTLVNAATHNPVDWSPSANKQRSKPRFAPHEWLTQSEALQMRDLFKKYDADGSGCIDSLELRHIWAEVWPWATEKEISKVAEKLVDKVDTDRSGTIDFEEFMRILELGYGDEAAEGGAFHA